MELDLGNLTAAAKPIFAVVLALIGLSVVGKDNIVSLFSKLFSRQSPPSLKPIQPPADPSLLPPVYPVDPQGRSSDQLPPIGFVEHLQVIQAVAPRASFEDWWNYALKGMTEAQVAREEAKLACHETVTNKLVVKESVLQGSTIVKTVDRSPT